LSGTDLNLQCKVRGELGIVTPGDILTPFLVQHVIAVDLPRRNVRQRIDQAVNLICRVVQAETDADRSRQMRPVAREDLLLHLPCLIIGDMQETLYIDVCKETSGPHADAVFVIQNRRHKTVRGALDGD
jgi:hypothetical protein